jgi:hypothetical protein
MCSYQAENFHVFKNIKSFKWHFFSQEQIIDQENGLAEARASLHNIQTVQDWGHRVQTTGQTAETKGLAVNAEAAI